MIDERLAKGFARQMLRDIKPPAQATDKAIDRLYDNYSRNHKGQARAIMRLSKKHKTIIASTHRDKGITEVIYWSNASYIVENTKYMDEDSLVTFMAILKSTRNEKNLAKNIIGPVNLCTHAIRRWIERDLTLPEYDLWRWVNHLTPIIIPAFVLIRAARDNQDYLHRPVALPTLGGLFVGFIVVADIEREIAAVQSIEVSLVIAQLRCAWMSLGKPCKERSEPPQTVQRSKTFLPFLGARGLEAFEFLCDGPHAYRLRWRLGRCEAVNLSFHGRPRLAIAKHGSFTSYCKRLCSADDARLTSTRL